MAAERPAGRRMVDRGKRRNLQDGQGKNPRSKCHFHSKRQGLGRHLPWPTQRHMGLSYWPAKGSRRSGSCQKARRNVSLKFRFRCNSEIRRRISPLRLIDPEEIEIALNCSACAYTDLKRFKTRIPDLQTGAILTVLNDGVVQLQFPLCCFYMVSANSEKVEFPN